MGKWQWYSLSDCLGLRRLMPLTCREQALEKTTQRLSDLGIENAELILDLSWKSDHYVTEPISDAAIFTWADRPSADKVSSLSPIRLFEAIEKSLTCFRSDWLRSYDGGDMEKRCCVRVTLSVWPAGFHSYALPTPLITNTPPFWWCWREITMITDIKENFCVQPNILIQSAEGTFEKGW